LHEFNDCILRQLARRPALMAGGIDPFSPHKTQRRRAHRRTPAQALKEYQPVPILIDIKISGQNLD
jgi:hypothetical protein